MVSGHLIIKPTIALQRLNLRDGQMVSPVERMQSPLPESDEGIVFDMAQNPRRLECS
jgi:hypothetical protein